MIRAAFVLSVVALLVSSALRPTPPATTVTLVPQVRLPHRISEDDPRWDCRTMGNRICGPNAKLPDGSSVGPHGFNCTRRPCLSTARDPH